MTAEIEFFFIFFASGCTIYYIVVANHFQLTIDIIFIILHMFNF